MRSLLRAAVAALLITTVACVGARPAPYAPSAPFPSDLAGRVTAACWGAVEAAASLGDGEDADSAVDDAIRACSSANEWGLATSRFPAVLGGRAPGDVLRDRCARLRGLASTRVCQSP